MERVSLVLGNILRTKNLQQYYDFDDMAPWSELLVSGVWAILSTHYSTLQITPRQLVFDRDMLSDLKFVADWKVINVRKQKDINRNNRQNSLRVSCDYQVSDTKAYND